MIKFSDPRLFLKGVGNVVLTDPYDGKVLYQSDKFTTGQVTSSVELGEIRAGIGNPIVAMLPSGASVTAEFTAADFNFWMKSAQSGASVSYGAPVPICANAVVDGAPASDISVGVSAGTPVAPLGGSKPICYVVKSGDGRLSESNTAYEIDPLTGRINHTFTEDGTYQIHYFVQRGTAELAKIRTLMQPRLVHFTAQFPVYANTNGVANAGTLRGTLYVVIPRLSLTPNGSVNGDQSNADTTMISGQALPDDSGISFNCTEGCDNFGADLAYYIYSPCEDSDMVKGLVVVGGLVSVSKSTSAQIPVRWLMPDNSLSVPTSYSDGFTYTASGLPTGTTVSNGGMISAGSTTGDGEVNISYTSGGKTFTTILNISVVA